MRVITALAAAAAIAAGVAAAPAPASAATTLYAPTPPSSAQLVTNEYAYWNTKAADAKRSADWENNSGSLFAKPTADGPAYWSGVVNDKAPNAASNPGTNTAIMRLTTKRADFGNVNVRTKLMINSQTATPSTPKVAWDGVHIFLRYQSEESLYYVSVARRDGAVVVKKKCRGGPSNGGTYYTLTSKSGYLPAVGRWTFYGASVKTNADNTVTINVTRADAPIMTYTDKGTGCAAITTPGKTGLRGDNTDFFFKNFTVSSL